MTTISVVMITYNHENYLEQAIESVLMQKGDFRLELLIGNDSSPDNTKEILKKYENDKRITIFNREKNMGATKNFLDLQLKCKGDYIAILEGDDYWLLEDKLSKQLGIFYNHKDAILCYGDSYVIDENEITIGKKLVNIKCIENFNSLMQNKGEIPTGTVIYKNIFKENRNKEQLSKVLTSSNIIGDLSLFAALIKEGKFYRLNEFVGVYRYITNSTSYSSKISLYKEIELYKVYEGISEYYSFSGLKKFLFLERRKYRILKEIKKEKVEDIEFLKNRGIKDHLKCFCYSLIKPLDDLKESLNKKRYRD